MKYLFPLLCALLASVALVAAPAFTPKPAPAKAGAIFDGKTLDRWIGTPGVWRIEDGAITGSIAAGARLAKNEFIYFESELTDFEFSLEYRISGPSANSGIQYRSVRENSGHAAGYQADLDGGKTWLGRIYDEHGRGLIVERGTLTTIDRNGKRDAFAFRDAKALAAVARQDDWNHYRILCRGHRTEIHVNGVHFSTLEDYETGKADLKGLIALQLHSGAGPAKIQFRNIHLTPFPAALAKVAESAAANPGIVPPDAPNIGFEKGDLSGWTVTGDAFEKQPAKAGSVAARNRGNDNADGAFFYGGYEFSGSDEPTGSMISDPFTVTHAWGALRVGAGKDKVTRVEIVDAASKGVIATFHGRGIEDMFQVSIDLRQHQGKTIQVRIVDEHTGGWGHVNYDDFRFYAKQPGSVSVTSLPRNSPVLRHLQKAQGPAWLPPGFALDTIDHEIRQPIAFTFDARGRIWVAEAYAYPKRQPEGQGKDRLVILEDADGDGSFETRKVFIDSLNLVSGFEIGYGGVFVGAAPQMLFIPDANRDDKPDGPPEVILDGFDTRDTHETPNSFMWGHDGWLYGCHGVFNNSRVGKPGTPDDKRVLLRAGIWRLHPQTHAFEIYAHGGSNQWGIDYDAEGNMFMTHCRSSWGKGPVSQVIRDGHYWTQNNAGHASFIATAARGWNRTENTLLNFFNSIAAYGHGEGGAGAPGSKAVFGGHSHVGAMVYLGDNWPEEYRGQLYTNNLHGAQMNRLFLSPQDSARLAHTHGRDPLLVDSPQYLGVDLKYGPDGAVYIIDWADKQHCHTNNVDAWDRSSGALYRLKYEAGFTSAPKLDLLQASDDQLLAYLSHDNEWYARMAQHVIRQRHPSLLLRNAIRERLFGDAHRFRHLVALHASGGLSSADAERLLADSAEAIRAQTIQYLTESDVSPYLARFAEIAKTDPSARVRLALAGACQHRIPAESAKPILETLAARSEDRNDRFIPKMIWYAYSKYPEADIKTLQTDMPLLRQSIAWRTGAEPTQKQAQSPLERGKAAFLICSACHKPGLQLPGPSLEEIVAAATDKSTLIAWMKKPVKKRPNYPEMPPFDKMDPQMLDDIATYVLSLRKEPKSANFAKSVLNNAYHSEGASVGDFNKDGKTDVTSGPYWYEAPLFKKMHEIYKPGRFSPNAGYANSFFSFPYDFNQDGWEDVLHWGLPGSPAVIYENPQNKVGHWPRHQVFHHVHHESPVFADIDGDDHPELLCNVHGKVGLVRWQKDKPFETWTWHPIGKAHGAHGLGFGDIDGDGLNDILTHRGWYQQVVKPEGEWPFHAANFGQGGAQMYAYDVDGDGDQDVITSLRAHGYGLAWFEHIKKDGAITFRQHLIMGKTPAESPHGICFSQLHALELKDINGDGLKDIITGKCFHAHNGSDPGAKDPAVMAYFQLSRKDGKVDFIPTVFDSDSGLGRQITVEDIDGDTRRDIVTGNKKGVFLFRQGTVDRPLTLTFEKGSIDGWTTEGEAFKGQPIKGDTVSGRPHTAGDFINPVGDYWIGGYERAQDPPQGRMISAPIRVSTSKASFMVGGGKDQETRVEIVDLATGTVIHTAHGRNRETLHRETVDLSALVGGQIQIRLIDEHSGHWGHINFDDFRFEAPPVIADLAADFKRGQPGTSNTHPNWHFHSDADANPANGGLEPLTWARTGTEGNSAFAGTGTIFNRKSLGPLPSISDLGLYDRVKAAPAGTLAAHPGQTSGKPEYLVIEYRADRELRNAQLIYRIDNPRAAGDGIDWRLLGPDFASLADGQLNGQAGASTLTISLPTGKSLWLIIGNGPKDNPGTDQTFVSLKLIAD